MTEPFHPFTTKQFKQETGLEASENEAIYIRWLNAQMNYANYQNLQQMKDLLLELTDILKQDITIVKH